jgi:CRISPR-associated protein Csx3
MQFLKTDLEDFQIITIVFGEGETLQPGLLCNLDLPEIDYTKGVVLDGRAPIWLYVHLMQIWHIAKWCGVNQPAAGGAIVTKSHQSGIPVGSIQSTALIV